MKIVHEKYIHWRIRDFVYIQYSKYFKKGKYSNIQRPAPKAPVPFAPTTAISLFLDWSSFDVQFQFSITVIYLFLDWSSFDVRFQCLTFNFPNWYDFDVQFQCLTFLFSTTTISVCHTEILHMHLKLRNKASSMQHL